MEISKKLPKVILLAHVLHLGKTPFGMCEILWRDILLAADVRSMIRSSAGRYFKNFNDTHGHDIGDVLLEEVGRRLLSCLRIERRLVPSNN